MTYLSENYDCLVKPIMRELRFAYDYDQLYFLDGAHQLSKVENDYLDALDAATAAGLTVGNASGIVDVLIPRQENFSARLEFSLGESPPQVIESADHVIEFDLTSSGDLKLEGSGGSGELKSRYPPATTGPGSLASTSMPPRIGHTTRAATRRITTGSTSVLPPALHHR